MNLELFSCSGGMAEGFRRAGIDFDFVFDKDEDACESYRLNLGHAPIRMDVHDLLRLVRAGWKTPVPVRLIVADPPCTPWSRAGKRLGLDDERDMLRETAELIALLAPDAYLIGNVPGLQDASSWGVVQEVIGGLAQHGYCVDDYAQLDAADFGVPQHRVRPFWFGHRAGRCVQWPHPTHCVPEDLKQVLIPGVEPLLPWVTCRQALQHLPLAELGRPVRLSKTKADEGNGSRLSGYVTAGAEEVAPCITRRSEYVLTPSNHAVDGHHPASRADEPARTQTAAGKASKVLLLNTKHPINEPDAPSRVVTATDHGGAQGARALAWPWDRPATTVTADDRQPPPGRKAPGERYGASHPNAVVLSERAAKILQGFPEAWTFAGKTKRSRWAMLGQAPPPLAEAVARAIKKQMELAP